MYPEKFKLDSIILMMEQEYTKAESVRCLEINPNLFMQWIGNPR